MKTETREVYISDDGQVFDSVEACQAHEQKTAADRHRIQQLKVYVVVSAFDGTEGRGYHRTTYILTDAEYAAVLQYCFDRFGPPLQGWYGDGYYESWHITEKDLSAGEALARAKQRHSGVGLSAGEADVVFLSDSDIQHGELPSRTPFWPRQKKSTKP